MSTHNRPTCPPAQKQTQGGGLNLYSFAADDHRRYAKFCTAEIAIWEFWSP